MQRRLFCPILAAAVLVTAVLGALDRAQGAIRITISDGTIERMFYSSENAAVISTDVGDFDMVFQSTITNWPGSSAGGNMTSLINLQTGDTLSGTLPTLTILTEVINSVPSLGTTFGMEVTGNSAVETAGLLRFTQPDFGALQITSGVFAGGATTGSVSHTVEVNDGEATSQANVGSPLATGTDTATNVPGPGGGYTLTSEVVLTGAPDNTSGLGITATASVTALTPEPGSVAVWCLGALGLVIAGATRRRLQRSQV